MLAGVSSSHWWVSPQGSGADAATAAGDAGAGVVCLCPSHDGAVRAMEETTQMVSTPQLLDFVRTQLRDPELGLLLLAKSLAESPLPWPCWSCDPREGGFTSSGLEEEGCPKTDQGN